MEAINDILDLNVEQRTELERQVRAELVRRYAREGRVLDWGKLLFPEKFTLPFCKELHQFLVDSRKKQFTNTEAPREHGKTPIQCFLIPIFQALNEPHEYQHYLNVQATRKKADAVNLSIRYEIENNELIRLVYGNQVDYEKWTERQFALKNGVVFTAISAGESLRGINHKNIRPDYVIVDDLYDEEHINNVDQTRKMNAWFWSSLFFARAKHKIHAVHVQGTAINKADLMQVLKGKERWLSRTFRAVKDFKTQEVLWRALNSFEDLMADKEDTGSVIWYREMQNERRDEETSIIKEAWLKFFNGMIPANETVIANRLGIDPSIGEEEKHGRKKDPDYTGIADITVTQLQGESSVRYYINYVWNERLSLDKRVVLLQGIEQRIDCHEARIEAIAGFKDFASEVERRTNLPVKEINTVKDKITNLENKSHWFENGKVFINKAIPKRLQDELIEQLTTNYPSHDDLRDAVLLCLDSKRDNIEFFSEVAKNLNEAKTIDSAVADW